MSKKELIKINDDLELVTEILKGNMDAFNILVNKYELSIFKFVYNMVRSREAAEDITQEIFITIYNKLYLYDKAYKFSNWIFKIARNKAIDYIRKYNRVYEASIEEYANLSSCSNDIEENAVYDELLGTIIKYINTLSQEDKQILFLRYNNEEMTFKDISDILSLTESTVKRRYYKIRENFKNQQNKFEGRCGI